MSFNCPNCNVELDTEKLIKFQSGDEITMSIQLADNASVISADSISKLISSYRETNIAIAKALGIETEVFITKFNMENGVIRITFKQELIKLNKE